MIKNILKPLNFDAYTTKDEIVFLTDTSALGQLASTSKSLNRDLNRRCVTVNGPNRENYEKNHPLFF